MKLRNALPVTIVLAALVAVFSTPAMATFGRLVFAGLSGYDEVPAINSSGSGTFKALIRNDDTIDYELRYGNLTGTVVQAHIHFGQKSVNGGVVAFLCGGPIAACGPDGASGTISAADVVAGAAAQGIGAGDIDAVIAAIRSGNAYVNVHSDVFPTGEIRGQIR